MRIKGNLQRNEGLRRRACAVCVNQSALLTVCLRDPVTFIENLFPPGGKIEAGEEPASAAIRETLEETGYVVVLKASEPVVSRYDFNWGGVIFDTETSFFLCELADPQAQPAAVSDADYNRGTHWVALERVSDAFRFHEPIRQAVLQCLELRTRTS